MNAGPTGAGPEEVPSTARWSWGKLGLLRELRSEESRGLESHKTAFRSRVCHQLLCGSGSLTLSASVSLMCLDEGNIYLTGCHVGGKDKRWAHSQSSVKAHSSSQPRLP